MSRRKKYPPSALLRILRKGRLARSGRRFTSLEGPEHTPAESQDVTSDSADRTTDRSIEPTELFPNYFPPVSQADAALISFAKGMVARRIMQGEPSAVIDFLPQEVREWIGRSERVDDLPEPEVIPAELAGRWIAWSPDGLRIVGSGDTPAQAREDAKQPTGAIQRVPSSKKKSSDRARSARS